MADFSKQYCESTDFGLEGDFDILEEADKLKPNSYTSIICEGYGFVGIAKDENNNILLAMPSYYVDTEQEIKWTPYSDVVK